MMQQSLADTALRAQVRKDMSKQYTNFIYQPWDDEMKKGRFWDDQRSRWKDE
jgi:hypothetical protein